MDLQRFFAMGGYAAYVWPAYGIALIVLVGMLLVRWRRLRAAEQGLAGGDARRTPAREPGS
jgi:heme exporter protein D